MTEKRSRFWLVLMLMAVAALLWTTRTPNTVLADTPNGKSPEGAPAIIQSSLASPDAPQAWSLTENFDVVAPAGWTVSNQSTGVGTASWFQGNDAVFPAHTGAPTAYAGVNFNSTTGNSTISNWLISPVLNIQNGDTWSFWTRTVDTPSFPDRLQVRISTGGTCSPGTGPTSTGDFTTLLLDINPTYTTTGFPNVWTNFSGTISGLGAPATGCFAFRYFVESGGPAGSNSDYIGVDTLVLAAGSGPTATPTTTAPTATATATTTGPTATATATTTGSGVPFYGVDLRAAPNVFFRSNTGAPEAGLVTISNPANDYYGGDFINNDFSQLYAINITTNNLVTLNTTTGVETVIGPMVPPTGQTWGGLRWDPSTSTLYAMSNVSGGGTLHTVNPATGAITVVAPFTGVTLLIDIAISPAGQMYGIDISDDGLYSINKATGVATLIGPTGINANFAQGMDFDDSTNTLYWPAYIGAGVNSLATVNTTTGAATVIGSFTNREVDAFAVATSAGGGPTATATATAGGPTVTATASATPGTGNRICSSTVVTIPDSNPTGATSVINVGTAGTISDLNVVLTGTHSWVGDLVFNISNGTTNVTFYDQPGVPASTFGCSGDNLPGVVGDDEGSAGSFENSCLNATPAYVPGGTYTGNNALSAFDGAAAAGNWTLTVSDLAAGDTGTLDGWCVDITTGGGGPTPTATPTVPSTIPDINVTPNAFTENHATPQTTNDTMNIQNVGAGSLVWTIVEDDSATTPVEDITDKVTIAPKDARLNTAAGGVMATRFLSSGAMAPSLFGGINLTVDDGVAEDSIGLTAGGQFVWFNRFTPAAGDFPFTLDEIQLQTTSVTNCAPTDLVDFYVYTDADGNPANGATFVGSLLNQQLGTLDQFNSFPVNFNLTGPGDVLIAVVNRGCTAAGAFPATIDTTASQVRSWIGLYAGSPANPPVFPAPTFGTIDSLGFAGNWLIRGVGSQGGGACSAPSDIPWLTVSPNAGTTAGGGSTPVTLTYNSAALANGTYTGTLCIASNDVDEALVTVPITLNVGGPTAIDLGSFTSPVAGVNLGDLAAAGLLLLAGAVLVLRRK
jgi:subtilisin-like proprotein convertase family protein